LGTTPPAGQIERRILAMALAIVVVWLMLGARLFHLQVLEGESFRASAERNIIRTHRVLATRGTIFDRNGDVLVDSRPAFDIGLVPEEVGDFEQTLTRLAMLMERDPAEMLERIRKPRGAERFRPMRVAHDVPEAVRARVSARLWALPGVLVQPDSVRAYRYGASAAHVLGRLGEISPNELARPLYRGYRSGDVIGTNGVERLEDRRLRGQDGDRTVVVDAVGREIQALGAVEAEPGWNITLTLDGRLQRVAEKQLEDLGLNGAIVALDPQNGEVLVLASRPAYDPNLFAVGVDPRVWADLNRRGGPLTHRAIGGIYPPGSIYKVIPALGALERGVDPTQKIRCTGEMRLGGRGRRYRCWKKGGHGPLDLEQALVQSCDVYFYEMGRRLGVDGLAFYARALGLGSRTDIGILGESEGLVPTSEWKKRVFKEIWYPGETLSVAIGQGANQWTPLQAASAYAAIGNGGTRYRPMLIKRLEGPRGEVEIRTPEELGAVPISRESLAVVRRALHQVVQHPRGTGARMRNLPGGVEAAAKTGTAQVVSLAQDTDNRKAPEAFQDHAWFVTLTPSEAPRIAVSVIVEHGGSGSSGAGPVARAVVEAFLTYELEAQQPEGPLPPPGADPLPQLQAGLTGVDARRERPVASEDGAHAGH
jgi:penicillin-binding protein 2